MGYKKERIFEVLGEDYNYAHQENPLGTGHAVMSAKDNVHPDHKIVVVISGDQPLVSKESIQKILNFHKENNSTVTLGTVALPDFNDWRVGLSRFGRIIRDEYGNVSKIIEYKDATEQERGITEVNPAIYVFDASWLWGNIDKLKNENSQGEYYLTDMIKLAFEDDKKISAVPVVNIIEGFQPNSKEELQILESILEEN